MDEKKSASSGTESEEPEIPGGPAATPNTEEGREAALEEGEEA